MIQPYQVDDITGFGDKKTNLSLERLLKGGYIDGKDGSPIGCDYTGITPVYGLAEKGMCTIGVWPCPENIVDQIVRQLEEAAENETDPKKASKLKEAANLLAKTGYNVAVGAVGSIVAGGLG